MIGEAEPRKRTKKNRERWKLEDLRKDAEEYGRTNEENFIR